MEPSDRTATNIQRIGRCNRYNQEINDKTNLYILPNLYTPPFMDGWDKREECEKFAEQKFYYKDIEKMRQELPLEPIPSLEKVKDFIKERIDMGLEPSLREIPITFEITKEINEYNNKTKKEEKVIKKFHIKPIGDEIPYADFPVRPIINKQGEIEELKKDIVLIQKRRVCNDFFIMLDNKVPVKTERIGEEKYEEIKMEETALDFSIEDLNKLKTFTDTATEIYTKIETKLNNFDINSRRKDNLKFKIFKTILNDIVEKKIQDNAIEKIHKYLNGKFCNLIEGWETIPFEKTSNFTQIFNKMIYYDIIIPENKEKNSFLEKSNEYQKYIQKNDFKKILNSFIEETLINDFGEIPPQKNEKIKNIDKKLMLDSKI